MAALFAAIFELGLVYPTAFDATFLLVVPIGACAIEFGMGAGLAAGFLSLALVFGWDVGKDAELSAFGYFSRAIAFLVLGWSIGRFVTAHRELEEQIARSEELSPDLMAIAGADGYFRRLNHAWERTLGWSLEELYSRPLIDLVHPDDRERSIAEIAAVSNGVDAIGFRNRYRARDGSYRWLEWNARVVTADGLLYANARDITFLREAEETIRRHGEGLERTIGERTGELAQARREILERVALAAEHRDDDTHRHTERVGNTSALLAYELGLTEATVQTIRHAAALHDVGKLGISDTILLKPGKLTVEEFRTMQEHTRIGGAILAASSSAVLRMAEEIALRHHERWDGSGYPDGLLRQQIPQSARITAIADVFDAITHKRPYQDSRPIAVALAEIRAASGTQFDPAAVEAFLTLDHATLVQDAEAHPPRTIAGMTLESPALGGLTP